MPSFDGISDPALDQAAAPCESRRDQAGEAPELWPLRRAELALIALALLVIRLIAG